MFKYSVSTPSRPVLWHKNNSKSADKEFVHGVQSLGSDMNLKENHIVNMNALNMLELWCTWALSAMSVYPITALTFTVTVTFTLKKKSQLWEKYKMSIDGIHIVVLTVKH